MLPAGTVTLTGDNPRHFEVELFIVHPSVDPAEITAALGLSGRSWKVGDRRKTPKGTPLDGVYSKSTWKYRLRHRIEGQWFSERFIEFLDQIAAHKSYLEKLTTTGGEISLNILFLGDGYFGDEIPKAALAKMVELNISFGIECYTIPDAEPMSFT